VIQLVHLGVKSLAVFDGNVVQRFLLLSSGDLIQYGLDACRQLSSPTLFTKQIKEAAALGCIQNPTFVS
jgi:hypothetical protein